MLLTVFLLASILVEYLIGHLFWSHCLDITVMKFDTFYTVTSVIVKAIVHEAAPPLLPSSAIAALFETKSANCAPMNDSAVD